MNCTYSDDVVEIIVSPILHVVGEHLDHLFQIKLPRSAKLQEEVVLVPWVLSHLVGHDPSFEVVKTLLLSFTHVSNIPKTMNENKLTYPLFVTFAFFFPHILFIILI